MADRMRLGFYMSSPMIGGAELYLKDILWSLDRRRYEVTLFYPPWPAFEEFLEVRRCPELRLRPVAVVEPGSRGLSGAASGPGAGRPAPAGGRAVAWLRGRLQQAPAARATAPIRMAAASVRYALMPLNARRLAAALRRSPVDVLHAINGGYPGAPSAQMAVVEARLAGCRGVAMTVANIPYPVRFPKAVERAVDRLVRRSVDAVIVATDEQGRCLAERRRFASSQLATIPYGVRDSYAADANGGADVPRAPLAPARGGLIGMVASFVPHKGHRHLLEATALLRDRVPEARVLLVGDGPTRSTTEALARRLGLDDRVTFLGFRPLAETLRLMRTLDVVTLPSELDCMPYAILHAMSLGKPVVATRVGAIPEMVVSGETGFVVPPGDPGALADTLARLLTAPAVARAMGLAGHARYRALFRLEPMLERHERLYARLYAGPPRPTSAGAEAREAS